MKHPQRFVLASAIALAVMCVSHAAMAYYPPAGNLYPGTSCRAIHAPGYDTYFDPDGHYGSGFQNTSSKVRYAVCPITRDAMTASDLSHVTTYISFAKIVVRSGTTCDLLTQPWTGAWSTTFPPDSTAQATSDVVVHTFNVNGGFSGWISLLPYMSAAFFCRVPPGGIIMNYWVNESYYE